MAKQKSNNSKLLDTKNENALDALIFIDTNVLLDFYRNRKNDIKMQLLDEIIAHKDLIISTFQIEMEFKKNRQSALGEAFGEFIKTKSINFIIPQMLSNHAEVKKLNIAKKELLNSQRILEEEFKTVFTDPLNHDEVLNKLEQLFRHKSPYILNQDNVEVVEGIINKAKQRFELGCPPRKDKDISIGDSVNWEWVLECAKKSGKSIILISRDGDYGYNFSETPLLNDFLADEFRRKATEGSQIILTNRFTNAFKLVKIPVTEEMITEEEEVIKQRNWSEYFAQKRLQEAIDALNSAMTINSSTFINPKVFETYNKYYKDISLINNDVYEIYQKSSNPMKKAVEKPIPKKKEKE